ncbi:MAG: ABC transporter permease [Bacillota bacterium]|nr:glutathione ABC transporter permease GsiD [Bacillota bacterium]REJ37269.1 MAG: glutathione ABC transporter permease GsiD [Bacillota bacterium]
MAKELHVLIDQAPAAPVGPGTVRTLWKRFVRRPAALFGLVIVTLFLATAVAAPYLAPYDPNDADFFRARQGPSKDHWLGTDELGRDVLSRLLYGARISLRIGLIAVAIGVGAGVPLGLVAGYYGRGVDNLIMRLVDIMLSFPSVLLAIGLVAILGPGLNNAIIAVGVVAIPVYIRQVRASVLGVKEMEFVAAARAAGASDARIMLVHVLPQCISPILVQSSLQIASAILSAAGLGFLGLGAPADVPEWGTMLANGRQYVFSAPHLTMFPGLAIMLVVMGFNLLGDGLRDALDPRMRGR